MSNSEDSYIEPSQLEIPYAMNFSSDEVQHHKQHHLGSSSSSNDSSSSCGSFDSNPQRSQQREPLRVNDVIQYTPAVFTAGTHLQRAVVLGIWPKETTFPLILDNTESLPWDTHIQRIGEFYKGQVYKHSGKIKPLSNFRLQAGGTKNVTLGLKEKATQFKNTIQQVQQRAMAALRGEWKPPPASTHKDDANKQHSSSSTSSSSSSSSSIMSIPNKKLAAKPTAITDRNNSDESSTSSCSLPIPIVRTIKVPTKHHKGFSLTKTNGWRANTTVSKSKRNEKQKAGWKYTGCSSDDDECLGRMSPKKRKNKTNATPYWDESSSSSDSNKNASLVPKHVQESLQQRRRQRKSISRGNTCLWSGSEDDNDDNDDEEEEKVPIHTKISTTTTTATTRRAVGKPNKSMDLTPLSDDDDIAYIVGQKQENRPTKPKAKELIDLSPSNDDVTKTKTTTKVGPLSGTMPSTSTSAKEQEWVGKSRAKTTFEMKRSSAKRGKIDTTMPCSDEDDDLVEILAKAKRQSNNPTTSNKKKYNNNNDDKFHTLKLPVDMSLEEDDEDLPTPTFSGKHSSTSKTLQHKKRSICYDADKDSEDEDDLLTKPIWRQKLSSGKKPANSASPSSDNSRADRKQTPGSAKKSFPRSPNNGSRSRLVRNLHQRKEQRLSSSTPTSRSSLEDSSNKKRRQYVLSSSSDDEYYKKLPKKKLSQWSTDCEVDSPPEDNVTPPPNSTAATEFDFSSHDENDVIGSSTKKRTILQSKKSKNSNKRRKIQGRVHN